MSQRMVAMLVAAAAAILIFSLVSADVSDMDPFDLCIEYDRKDSQEDRAEIERRDLISQSGWDLIDANRIRIGMRELALLCSSGHPWPHGDINQTVTAQTVGDSTCTKHAVTVTRLTFTFRMVK